MERFKFEGDEVETLKAILKNCQQLERIKVRCGDYCLSESKLLEVVANHSPETFHELKMNWWSILLPSEIFLEELEPILMSYSSRKEHKVLSKIFH